MFSSLELSPVVATRQKKRKDSFYVYGLNVNCHRISLALFMIKYVVNFSGGK